jgi:ABC-type enterochelin transport system permease subunit
VAPTQLIADNLEVLWLFGPPASLIYGTKFVWPFCIGTTLIVALLYAAVRVETQFLRGLVGLVFAAVWALAGFIAYAPGA